MSPWTMLDIQKIILNAGYGREDFAAVEISRKYNKKLYTSYKLKVHYDWA